MHGYEQGDDMKHNPRHGSDHNDNTRAASDDTDVARVVVADDDPDALELLGDVLRPLDIHLEMATSGSELVVLLADHGPFDLIVTDIDMPWMEGLGVIRSARTSAIDTPVLFVSGIARPDLEASIACLGNARLLRKPIAVAALRAAVSDMLGAWRARQAGRQASGEKAHPRAAHLPPGRS
jgi:CheY-like chemotaxis protein